MYIYVYIYIYIYNNNNNNNNNNNDNNNNNNDDDSNIDNDNHNHNHNDNNCMKGLGFERWLFSIVNHRGWARQGAVVDGHSDQARRFQRWRCPMVSSLTFKSHKICLRVSNFGTVAYIEVTKPCEN